MVVTRRWLTVLEETFSESGLPLDNPWRKCAVAAVVRNPWHGHGYVADLSAEVAATAPEIAKGLVDRLLDVLGGPDEVEAFGKGAIVGLSGEIEHGAALIHTPHYGDHFRDLVNGTSVINFADTRASAGTSLVIPVWHKTRSTTRSHYQTVEVSVPDAPKNDEIVIIAAAATGGRPFARIGDRSTDQQ
ncbi:amino acid synthesis family protein [Planosporangium flavigriseum]|uniref:Peptide synthetase n=1 Tax=Planosporangium flavigriseum TaxID=373681 RepID=A0A8J3PMM2_9ACTN|nr:amino acid synthesis family protein [Planosporangium flavigriseum]GIG73076.1 peptide synthetase [Planosporangium flavigriseum]